MIDPHWDVSDLDPVTWRAIGEYILPVRYVRAGTPDEHALYILHDEGRVLNIVDNRTGRRTDLGIERVGNPETVAADLHARGEWDRVHVVDRQHLKAVSTEAQSDPRHDLTLDAYYRFVSSQFWDGEGGYVTVPPRATSWNGWTWGGVKAWVEALGGPAAVGLGVVGADGLEIGLLAVVSDGLVRRLTTFEALPIPREDAAVTADYHQRTWEAVEERIAPPAALLICTPEVFREWLTGPAKRATIEEATAAGTAFLRAASS
jgi:hypothetical protein